MVIFKLMDMKYDVHGMRALVGDTISEDIEVPGADVYFYVMDLFVAKPPSDSYFITKDAKWIRWVTYDLGNNRYYAGELEFVHDLISKKNWKRKSSGLHLTALRSWPF